MLIITIGKRGGSAPRRSSVAGRALAVLFAAGTCAPAAAAQWDVRPFLNAGAIYDDNIRLQTGPHESTSGYIAAARLEAKRTTETSKTDIVGSVVHTAYRQEAIEDKTEQWLRLDAENKTSERGTLGLKGEYRREALFENVIVTEGTGDVRDTDVGLSTSTQVRRNYLVFNPSWNWLLTERSSVRISYRLTDANFSKEADTGLFDYRDDLLSASYARQINPRDNITVTTNAARYRPSGTNSDADTLQLLVGIGRAFSETLQGSFAVGGSRTKVSDPGREETASGVVTTASLRQRGEISTLEGIISRDITPSGIGRALRTDQLRLWWSRRLSPQLEFVLDARLLRTEAIEGTNRDADRRYYDIAPQLRWQWLENIHIVGSYRHRRQQYDISPDSADSNAVFLGLSYRL